MKRILATLSLLAIFTSGILNAQCCPDYSFYMKVGSGISFSENASITAPADTWNPAVQGYDSTLGNGAIAGLSIGCEIMRTLDVELGISTRCNFKYRKFQTPVSGGDSYTREFDLDVIPVLLSFNFLGRDIACLNWNVGCGQIYPVVGLGLGVSNILITNFRTTGLPPTGDSDPFSSFSAENQYTLRKNFTYTALLGFEYNYSESWAMATGYRWFDAGSFDGPRYLRVNPGAAIDVGDRAWKMNFRSHEWFVELKLYL